MSKDRPQILIAAGGTGGHVFPAIAIADEIRKLNPDSEFLFTGTKGKIEERLVPQRGYAITFIWISGFHRSLRIDNLIFPLKVFVSLFQSYFVIRKFQPDAVIGTGGYVCGPVLLTASIMGFPAFVHESNSLPGLTTRMLSRRASRVFTAFDVTADRLKRRDNVECIGTPTRDSLSAVTREEGLKFFDLDPSKKSVFVFGGSLGASSINRTMHNIAESLNDENIQIIWQTGKTGAQEEIKVRGTKNCRIFEFIDKIEYAYAAADLVVCRSGATTIAELTRLGKPSILVPYPFAADDHQTFNAQTLVDAGASVMIADKEVQIKLKGEILSALNDDKKLEQMSTASRKLGKPEAGKEIARRITDIIR